MIMRCFSCINTPRKRLTYEDQRLFDPDSPSYLYTPDGKEKSPFGPAEQDRNNQNGVDILNSAQSFTFQELAVATRNFKESNLIGEGGFGKVYKGRLDNGQGQGHQSLAVWSRPYLKDRRKYTELVDSRLRGKFPTRSARHLIAVTSMCLNDEPHRRPSINDIVVALDYLANECVSPQTASSTAKSTPTRFSPLTPEHKVNPRSPLKLFQKDNSPKKIHR
ncbi:hypothetical protein SOVF_167640 [Spinacia oleracea]|nr:hypothetical protein SOVF_167640 [Spinacia oleracea]